MANVENAAGDFVAPTPDSASKALEAAEVAPDLTYNPIWAEGEGAYPITSPTWMLVDAATDRRQGRHDQGVPRLHPDHRPGTGEVAVLRTAARRAGREGDRPDRPDRRLTIRRLPSPEAPPGDPGPPRPGSPAALHRPPSRAGLLMPTDSDLRADDTSLGCPRRDARLRTRQGVPLPGSGLRAARPRHPRPHHHHHDEGRLAGVRELRHRLLLLHRLATEPAASSASSRFVWGTVVISLIGIVLAVPVSIGIALFATELAPPPAPSRRHDGDGPARRHPVGGLRPGRLPRPQALPPGLVPGDRALLRRHPDPADRCSAPARAAPAS